MTLEDTAILDNAIRTDYSQPYYKKIERLLIVIKQKIAFFSNGTEQKLEARNKSGSCYRNYP